MTDNKPIHYNEIVQFSQINQFSAGRSRASLWMGRLNTPLCTFMLAMLTKPSLPLNVWITLPRGHLAGTMPSSCRTTVSLTEIFLVGLCNLVYLLRLDRYSWEHLSQKCLTRFSHKSQCCKSEVEWYEKDGSGRDSVGLPIRKCMGVKASIPSSLHESATSQWLFKHTSIWVITVEHSSKMSFTSADTSLFSNFQT